MQRFIPRRPSPAMVVAVIALVAALGGTAVAGGFLKTKKFKRFKVEVSKELDRGVRGPVTYASRTVAVPNALGVPTHVAVDCPAGTHVTGGGVKLSVQGLQLNDSYPTTSGWAGDVFNSSNPSTQSATVTAICAVVKETKGSAPAS